MGELTVWPKPILNSLSFFLPFFQKRGDTKERTIAAKIIHIKHTDLYNKGFETLITSQDFNDFL